MNLDAGHSVAGADAHETIRRIHRRTGCEFRNFSRPNTRRVGANNRALEYVPEQPELYLFDWLEEVVAMFRGLDRRLFREKASAAMSEARLIRAATFDGA